MIFCPRRHCRHQPTQRIARLLALGLALAPAAPALSQLSELSPPLSPAQVACDQAQLERLQARMVSSPFQGNLILWRSGLQGGAFGGVAVTRGLFPGDVEPRTRNEKQLAFDLTIVPGGDFLNPRRSLLPQALLARRSVATNLDAGTTATLEATLDLAPTVPNQFLPQRPVRIDSRRNGAGVADGAGRGLVVDDLATTRHGNLTNFDLTMFEILSRTLRATRCLAPPTFCNPFDEFNFNITFFRGEASGTYRANVYISSQDCAEAPCETSSVFARPEVEVKVEVDTEGRLKVGRASFLPFCVGTRGMDCTDAGPGPWAIYILPPIWAGHEVQGTAEFQKGGFLNVLSEGSSDNVLTTTFDWSVLLAGTAWGGPLR